MKFKLIIAAMIAGFVTGCVSVNSVSLTSVPAQKDHKVSAMRSKFIVLGLTFDNDFINDMTDDLKNQCPNGQIQGILTKDEIIDYFLIFFYSHRVTATGYCSSKVAGS